MWWRVTVTEVVVVARLLAVVVYVVCGVGPAHGVSAGLNATTADDHRKANDEQQAKNHPHDVSHNGGMALITIRSTNLVVSRGARAALVRTSACGAVRNARVAVSLGVVQIVTTIASQTRESISTGGAV